MKISPVFVFLHLLILVFCFNEEESEIVLELMHSLGVKQCILVGFDQVLSAIKMLSNDNIMAVSFDLLQLDKHFSDISFSDVRNVIVLKSKNDFELVKFLKELKLKVISFHK